MIPKRISDISIADLQALINSERAEDRTIEYKSELPGNGDGERIPRFLKPICSFANTDGGDLVIGVSCQDGLPDQITGVEVENFDRLKLTLEQYYQNGIEPQVRGITISPIRLGNNRFVLVIRIPKSWVNPHRIKSNSRFYARNNSGCYELDIPQIKNAFLLTDSILNKIRDFRAERVSAIHGGNTPMPIRGGARIALHIVPLSSFTGDKVLSVPEYKDLGRQLNPYHGVAVEGRLNFDGMIITNGLERDGYRAYVQLYRSGIIEYVDVYSPQTNPAYIPGEYEQDIVHRFQSGMNFLHDLGFEAPIYLFLNLIAVKNYALSIPINRGHGRTLTQQFNKDVYMIPELQLESITQEAPEQLKPLFDMAWNAVNCQQSFNFNNEGRYAPRNEN